MWIARFARLGVGRRGLGRRGGRKGLRAEGVGGGGRGLGRIWESGIGICVVV